VKHLLFLTVFWGIRAMAQSPESYPVDSASTSQPGVPKGEILKFTFARSKIFPGTHRDYWVYIPAEYRPEQPACVFVNQDAVQWNAPTVFDNLIYHKEMPVTIGIFISPGQVPAPDTASATDRYNRSFEYDGLGDAYARFVLEEILPDVVTHQASDGRPLHLSNSANDRAIGGSSSGAIAAFTAAWESGAFTRVFSVVGTYVGLRGGDRYPTLIRKYEPKPLRIYMQDGSGDMNIYGGDWWEANQMMERALTFAGYAVNHAWGLGGHNGKMGTSVFPDAMRWLWKDWPAPVQPGPTKNTMLNDILLPGEGWELVGQGYGFTEGSAVDATGIVYYQDIPNAKTYRVGLDGHSAALLLDAKKASGTAFGPDGMRYTCTASQVLRYDAADKETVIAEGIPGNDLVVANNGNIYVTAPDGTERPGKIYLVKPDGTKTVVDEGLKFVNGIALSPDQTQLYATESASHWVWIYSIQPDGTLTNKQKFGWLHVPDTKENAWPDGLRCDRAGHIFVATNMGIQVLDAVGRVNAILPVPSGQVSNLCFGGPDFDVLYVTCVDKVYRRKVKVHGANAFAPPIRPSKPNL
jgi:gluconolactonase